MQVTKFEHSCVVLEKGGKKLIFDPVEFAETLPDFDNVVAVVITHIHADHLQPERITAILESNPEARLIAPEDAAAQLPNATLVKGGEEMQIEDFNLKFFGKNHAEVFEGKVPCENIGVVVNERLTNPGDSFDLLELNGKVEALLVPEAAPWAKMSETVEFIKLAKPGFVIPVHDAVLSEMGKNIYNNLMRAACVEVGAEFAPLSVGESMDI